MERHEDSNEKLITNAIYNYKYWQVKYLFRFTWLAFIYKWNKLKQRDSGTFLSS